MHAVTRTIGNKRGAAAVEFAIVGSVLLSLIFGVTDLVPGLLAKLKSANATSSAADLVTQSQQLKASDMTDIYAGASNVLAPFSASSLVLRVTSVYSDGKGNAFVQWSCGQGALPAYAAMATIATTPSGDSVDVVLNRSSVTYGGATYGTANTSFVMTESRYTYTAPTQYVLRNALTFINVAYSLPRQSSFIVFPWSGNAGATVTAPASATQTTSVTLSNGSTCNYVY